MRSGVPLIIGSEYMRNKITISTSKDIFTVIPTLKKWGIKHTFFLDSNEMYAKDNSRRIYTRKPRLAYSTCWETCISDISEPNIIINNFGWIPPEYVDRITDDIISSSKNIYIFNSVYEWRQYNTSRVDKLMSMLKENNIGFDFVN